MAFVALEMHRPIVEVRLPILHALRQTSTTITVMEELQEISSDGTRMYRPKGSAGRDPGVCSVDIREIYSQSAASPAIRVPARSRNIPVSRVKCAATKRTVIVASPVLLVSSTGSVVTTAVLTAVEGARAVAVRRA